MLRPCRGLRAYRGSRRSWAIHVTYSKDVKYQLRDAHISAESHSAHADHSWRGVAVSLQHLPSRGAEAQQLGAARERPPQPSTESRHYPDVDRQQRPTCSTGNSSSSNGHCDCAPSTSASTSTGGGSANTGAGGERRPLNDRDAALLTARITRTHSLAELQEVVLRYGRQFNHIHTAAAIVKLAKLASGSAGREASSASAPAAQQQEGGAPQDPTAPPPAPAPAPAAAGATGLGAGRSGPEASPPDAGARPQLPPDPGGLAAGSWQAPRRSTARAAPAAPCAAALLADLAPTFLAQQHQYPTARQFANVVWALGVLRSRDHPQLLAAAEARLLADGGSRLAGALPQELSNLALGLAKVGYREVPLWAAIIAAAKRRLQEFKPQELHNLAWAVAAASQDRSMISAAVQAALPLLRGFNASGLANMLWACATAQCPCEELFDGAAELLLAAPPGALNSQDAANTAWAFAKMQHPHPRLARHLARWVLDAGPGGLRLAATCELVSLMWAFASVPPPPLAPGASGASAGGGARGRELGSSGSGAGSGDRGAAPVAMPAVGGAGGAAGGSSSRETQAPARPPPVPAAAADGGGSSLLPQLLRPLLSEVAGRGDLTAQGASNALWACGRVQPCSLPAAPLAALLRAASALGAAMSDQELCSALWAAGELRHRRFWVPVEVAAPMLALACCPARLEALPPAQLTELVTVAVRLRLVGSGEMDALATRVLRCLPAAGPQEVCTLAGAVAEAVMVSSYCNPMLLNGLANAAVAVLGRLDPQGLSTLLWSFARAKHYHGPLTTSICRVAQPRLRDFSDFELANLVWALAVLKCQERQLLVRVARALIARMQLRRQLHEAAQQQAQAQQQGLGRPGQGPRAQEGPRLEPQQPRQPQQLQQPAAGQGHPPAARAPGSSGVSSGAASAPGAGVHSSPPAHGQAAAGLRPAAGAPAGGAPGVSSGGATNPLDPGQGSVESGTTQASGGAAAAHEPAVPATSACGSGSSGVGGGGGARASTAAAGPPAAPPPMSALTIHARPLRLPAMPHPADVSLQAHRPPPRDGLASDSARASGPSPRHGSTTTSGARALSDRPDCSDGEAADSAGLLDAEGNGPGGANLTARGHAKSMCKLLWGFAKCDLYSQPLYRLLVAELRPLVHLLTPHELTQALWAAAYHGHACPELLEAAAPAVTARLRRLCAWDGSVLAWSYAKLQHPHRALFEALQLHALRVAEYNEPCLFRLTWALAQLQLPVSEQLRAQLEAMRGPAPGGGSSGGGGGGGYEGADRDRPQQSNAGRVEPEW